MVDEVDHVLCDLDDGYQCQRVAKQDQVEVYEAFQRVLSIRFERGNQNQGNPTRRGLQVGVLGNSQLTISKGLSTLGRK